MYLEWQKKKSISPPKVQKKSCAELLALKKEEAVTKPSVEHNSQDELQTVVLSSSLTEKKPTAILVRTALILKQPPPSLY